MPAEGETNGERNSPPTSGRTDAESDKCKASNYGIAALTLGIVSLVISPIPVVTLLTLPTAITAIVLGVKGHTAANRVGAPKGYALAGWILGVIATSLYGLFLAIILVTFVGPPA